jgi:hypothetical protein
MNWFEYLRGYEDGQRDGRPVNRNNNNGGGIIIALLRLLMNLVWLAVVLCYYFLKALYKLFRKML